MRKLRSRYPTQHRHHRSCLNRPATSAFRCFFPSQRTYVISTSLCGKQTTSSPRQMPCCSEMNALNVKGIQMPFNKTLGSNAVLKLPNLHVILTPYTRLALAPRTPIQKCDKWEKQAVYSLNFRRVPETSKWTFNNCRSVQAAQLVQPRSRYTGHSRPTSSQSWPSSPTGCGQPWQSRPASCHPSPWSTA